MRSFTLASSPDDAGADEAAAGAGDMARVPEGEQPAASPATAVSEPDSITAVRRAIARKEHG